MKKQVMEDNINGFPGYHITREGLLYSRYNKVGKLTKVYHKNKPYTRSNGYQQIVLKIRKLGLVRRAYIHRLVAEAYIPNPLNKPCVCHKDNLRTNNHHKNLYWGTHKENSQQMVLEGRSLKGIPRKTKLDSEFIRKEWETGNYMSLRELGRKYSVSHTTIKRYLS